MRELERSKIYIHLEAGNVQVTCGEFLGFSIIEQVLFGVFDIRNLIISIPPSLVFEESCTSYKERVTGLGLRVLVK